MAPCHFLPRQRRGTSWLLWTLLIAASGCGEEVKPIPTAAPANDAVCQTIQQALPKAAGMLMADFERLEQSPERPPLESFDSQPLSLLLFYADPEAVDVAGEAYRQFSIHQRLEPEQVANVYSESASQGYVSALQPQRLVNFECTVEGSKATGQATYELHHQLYVTVHFTAEQECEQWQVQRFELPAWRIQSVRQPDGHWLAEGGLPQRPPVNLVHLDQHWRRLDVGLVRYLVWAGMVDGRPVAWIDGQMIEVPVDADSVDVSLTPVLDALRAMRDGELQPMGHSAFPRMVLRVDRDFPCGALRSLLMATTQVGLQHISLAAQVVPGDERQFPPQQMRWRRRFPMGNIAEYPFDADPGHRQPPVARLPMYIELKADEQGNLAQRLLDRNEAESNEALVEAVLAALADDEMPAPREIRVYYDNHLRFGEAMPIMAALARELDQVKASSSEESGRAHRIEIITEQHGP